MWTKQRGKAFDLGGTIVMPPTDIPNVGRFCQIQDPTGAVFSVITLKIQEQLVSIPEKFKKLTGEWKGTNRLYTTWIEENPVRNQTRLPK